MILTILLLPCKFNNASTEEKYSYCLRWKLFQIRSYISSKMIICSFDQFLLSCLLKTLILEKETFCFFEGRLYYNEILISGWSYGITVEWKFISQQVTDFCFWQSFVSRLDLNMILQSNKKAIVTLRDIILITF